MKLLIVTGPLLINNLQLDHALVILVADNLTTYVDQVRHNPPKVLAGNPEELYPDGRYNHVMQVHIESFVVFSRCGGHNV